MAEIDIGDGIVVRAPDGTDVRVAGDDPLRRGLRRATRGAIPAADALRTALESADFKVAREIEIAPVRPGTRTLRSAGGTATEIEVTPGPAESALVLVETEGGVYAWVFPNEQRSGPAGRRGGGARTLTFSLAPVAPPPGGRSLRLPKRLRGVVVDWLAERIVEPVRAYVVTFVARRSVDQAVAFIEGDMREGLASLGEADPQAWHPGGAALPRLDRTRPARVLLMVHGTFSSTSGGFAALAGTPAGRAFLDAARAGYDAVLGFDHKTLAIGPNSNAEDLAAALEQYGLPHGSTIDAVAHSRGGLVYRAFESLWAQRHPEAVFGKAVFVGCTNAGTHLAEPANWAAMLDLYTNVVMAGTRGALALAGAAAYAPLVTDCIKTIGRFVQALSEVAIGEDRVPGLAAMQPSSGAVRALNEAKDGLDRLAAYHAVTSNFVAEVDSGRGITRDLVEFIAHRVTGRLFGDPNDLVVDTASMTTFGSRQSRLGALAVMALADIERVYHTAYFAEPAVAARIGDWLAPAETPATKGTRSARLLVSEGLFGTVFGSVGPGAELFPGLSGLLGGISIGGWSSDDLQADAADGGDIGAAGRAPEGAASSPPPPSENVDVTSTRRRAPAARRALKTSRAPSRSTEASKRKMMRKPARAAPAPPPGRPKAAPAETTAACHFAAEMDPHPPLKTPTPVFVTVSREAIAIAANEAARTTVKPVSVERGIEITLEVIARKNARVLGEAVRTIEVPDKEEVTRFRIEGIAPGIAELLVEARQGVRTLVSFSLKPVFIEPTDTKLGVSRSASTRAPAADEPAVLRIYEIEESGKLSLRFDLACHEPNINVSETMTLKPGFSRDAYVADIYRTIEGIRVGDSETYDRFLFRLQANGKTMARDLLPERVRTALWRHGGEIRAIQVISGEPLIPWELLYVTDPEAGPEQEGFLGEWGLVRWLYDTDWPGRSLKLRKDRVRYIVPDYADPGYNLDGAKAEREMLARVFDEPREVAADSLAVARFLRAEAKHCDVLHFACHGEVVQRAVMKADLLMSGTMIDGTYEPDPLTSDVVRAEAVFAGPRPSGLVFINACQTGRGGISLSKSVGGFVEAFLQPFSKRGAATLVAALWSVDDHLALAFAKDFYGALLAGDSLVEAARAGRTAAKTRKELTWLAYTVYGNPFARIEGQPPP